MVLPFVYLNRKSSITFPCLTVDKQANSLDGLTVVDLVPVLRLGH